MPRTPHPKRYDRLRVEVLAAEVIERKRSGRAMIRDVLLTLRKPAGEVTRAWMSYATLRAHGLVADGRLSVVGGHYDVAIRGLGDGRSVIREWGAECTVPTVTIAHERDIAHTQLAACALVLGLDAAPLLAGDVYTVTTAIVDRITKHERTIALAQSKEPQP